MSNSVVQIHERQGCCRLLRLSSNKMLQGGWMIISCYMLLNVIFRNRFPLTPPPLIVIQMLWKNALMGLGELGLLRCGFPHNGFGSKWRDLSYLSRASGRYSGALAFLQTQHQSAAAMRSVSEFSETGGISWVTVRFYGVGFSHLRRAGDPLIVAVPATGGISWGHVPWVTGFGLFQEFIVAAALPDGQAVFGVPFVETYQMHWVRLPSVSRWLWQRWRQPTPSPPLWPAGSYPRARRLGQTLKVGFRKTIKECSQTDWIGSRVLLPVLIFCKPPTLPSNFPLLIKLLRHSTGNLPSVALLLGRLSFTVIP